MAKIRQSEETARELVYELKNTKDLEKFLRRFSECARRYGQYSEIPRKYFTDTVIENLEGATIIFKENDNVTI